MYNNNVKFCCVLLKKLGIRYLHGISVDFKVVFFSQNTGPAGNNYDLKGRIYIE